MQKNWNLPDHCIFDYHKIESVLASEKVSPIRNYSATNSHFGF